MSKLPKYISTTHWNEEEFNVWMNSLYKDGYRVIASSGSYNAQNECDSYYALMELDRPNLRRVQTYGTKWVGEGGNQICKRLPEKQGFLHKITQDSDNDSIGIVEFDDGTFGDVLIQHLEIIKDGS